jgi:hypothetical protein
VASALLVVVSVVATPQPTATLLSIEASSITLPTQTNETSTPSPSPSSSLPPPTSTVTSVAADTSAPTLPVGSDPGDEVETSAPTSTPTSLDPGTTTSLVTQSSAESSASPIGFVVWQGDSVAFDAAPGVIAALSASGPAVTAQTVLGFGLVDDRALGSFVEPVAAEPPDVAVFMLSGWDGDHDVATQTAAFDRYADAWRDLGTRLVVVEPPPVDPTRHQNTTDTMLGIARLRAAAFPGEVQVLDAGELWGPFATDIDGDGQPERKPDGVHVCPTAAALLGFWLSNELAQRFAGITPADPSVWVGGAWVNDPRYDDPPGACR